MREGEIRIFSHKHREEHTQTFAQRATTIPFNSESHSVKGDVTVTLITQVEIKGLEKLKVNNITQLVRSSKFLALSVLSV